MLILTGDGQSNPLSKISGLVKDTSKNVKNTGAMMVSNVKDACDMFGECVRENGARAVNKTVTITKESLNKIPVQSITDIITKAKCVIPKNADNILRAALLQQCISPGLGKRIEELF